MKSREEKIRFLKAIATGQKSLSELAPKTMKIIIGKDSGKTKFFIDEKEVSHQESVSFYNQIKEKIKLSVSIVNDDEGY